MDQQNPPGNPPPPLPDRLLEIMQYLAQGGTLPPLPIPQPLPQVAAPIPDTPTPPTQARVFNRTGRGTGGALSDKQRVSKEITAPAMKCKSQLEPNVEIQLSPIPEAAESSNKNKAKRPKLKVSACYVVLGHR